MVRASDPSILHGITLRAKVLKAGRSIQRAFSKSLPVGRTAKILAYSAVCGFSGG